MFKFNGVVVATPKSYKWDQEDIYDSNAGRNARADFIGDIIATKRKLSLEWGPLTMTEISTLLKASNSKLINVEFPDAYEGKLTTKTFYKGPRSAPMYRYNSSKGVYLWEGLSMNLIER